ncbi:MAG: hypothetical protein GF401_02055 [Chitinivibrionales bacterium]|nr:hypothetical protein [Chitinivibrionales bacterium]
MGNQITASELLLIGYLIGATGLVLFCYMISAFYHKKFTEPSPKLGFMIALILWTVLFCSILIVGNESKILRTAQTLLLIGGSIAAGWNSVLLYYIMKKPRK